MEYVTNKIDKATAFVVKSDEYFVPLEDLVDEVEELKKFEEELKYAKGFLASVEKKLNNEKFVNNAPEQVVAMEKKKKEDAVAKIKVLEEKIKSFK